MKYKTVCGFLLLLCGCVTMAAPKSPGASGLSAQSPHRRPVGFWTNEKAVVQVLHIFSMTITDPNGKTATQQLVALGTGGVVVNKNGFVLTNNHVVAKLPNIAGKNHDTPDIYLVCRVVEGNRNCDKAKVMATDPANDLALLRADRHFSQAVKFVDDSMLMPGDEIYFWGNVFSILPPSPFFGRYIGRVEPPYYNKTGLGALPLLFMDITAVNGSSGSPVFNELGQCIGVVVAYFPSAIGGPRPLGVIIPSSTVIKFLKNNSR
jgi:S1-C subfamily serine protease